jgi:tetratricopeptide (TPR) repeat protein
MRWQIKLPVHAPILELPHPQRHCPAILQLDPFFTFTNTKGKPSIALGPLLDDTAFELRWTETWEQLPPRPWQLFLGTPNPAELKNACQVEAALALRVLDVNDLGKKQPISPGKIHHQLTQTQFPQNIREAFAFALFDLKMPLENLPILEEWQQAVRQVIHEHGLLSTQEHSTANSNLLEHGYRLLELISQQRQNEPSSAELVKKWEEFNEEATIKLPLIFAIVYWDEAAHRLIELGEQPGAQALLEKQNQALSELLALLPYLSEDLEGGLWRHHLGRLAYYRGKLEKALQQYGIEWQLREQESTVKNRLQHSIARVLLDMGYLHPALLLAQETIKEQRRSNAPNLYKTLGHLGDIYLRQADYSKAIEHFSESWKKQPQATRDGQAAIYLGHAHLLQGELEQADNWYQQADKANKKQHIVFNPWLIMGEVALAQRQGNTKKLKKLWQTTKEKLEGLESREMLPAAVIATAVSLTDSESVELVKFIEKLINEGYLIEAIYPLVKHFTTPTEAGTQLQTLIDGLTRWQTAVDALQKITQESISSDTDDDTKLPTPVSLQKALQAAQQSDNWQAVEEWLPRIYPMNLIS